MNTMSATNYPEPPTKENSPTLGTKEQALTDLAYLWKRDDSEWVAQRETDWQTLLNSAYSKYPKVDKNELERYFKHGEKTGYIPVKDLFFLTPYDSSDSLIQLFNSSLLDDLDREQMFSAYVFGEQHFELCHWFEHHTALIIETILGETYCKVIEQISLQHSKIISPDPSNWCRFFINQSKRSLRAKQEWLPFYSCINYFISALPYALDEIYRQEMTPLKRLRELMQLANESLAAKELSGRLLIFVLELKNREREIFQAWDMGAKKIAQSVPDRLHK